MAQLSFGTKLVYSLGQIAVDAKDTLFHYFYLFFFNSVLGIGEFFVAFAKLFALMIDAITDPLMGSISDNWRSEFWGRRHLFMALSIVPLGIGMWLLFSPPAAMVNASQTGLSSIGLMVWMVGFAVLVRLSLTLFFIPYIALNAELTDDYDERTGITTLRTTLGTIAGIVIGMVAFSVFLQDTPEFPEGRLNPFGYAKISLMAAITAAVAVTIATFGTLKQVSTLPQKREGQVKQSWWRAYPEFITALRDKTFRSVTLGFTFFSIMAGLATAAALYLMTYFWGLSTVEMFLVIFGMGIAIIPGAIIAPVMAKILDKKVAILTCTVIYAASYVLPIYAHIFDLTPSQGEGGLFKFVFAYYFVGQIFAICIKIISESMMADVSDHYELITGQRQEGVLFAGIMLARKASFGIGGILTSFVLFVSQFPEQTAPEDVPAPLLDNFGFVLAPMIGFLLVGAFVFYLGYPVTRAKHLKTLEELEARRKV